MATGTRDGDAGYTLTEVMVSTAVMAVASALTLSGVVMAFRFTSRTELTAQEQSQAHTVFARLDQQLHYAYGFSLPAQVNGRWYVEYQTSDSKGDTCAQIRVDPVNGILQTRNQTGANAPSSWSVLASYVTNPIKLARVIAATDGQSHQQLQMQLALRAGSSAAGSVSTTSMTFVALNTSVATSSDAICAQKLDRP